MSNELPLVTNADEITPETHPEMFAALCSGYDEGDDSDE